MEHIKIIVKITLSLRLSFTLKSFFTPKYWLSIKEIGLRKEAWFFHKGGWRASVFSWRGILLTNDDNRNENKIKTLSWNSFDHQKEVSSHVYSHYTFSFSFAAVRCWSHQPRGKKRFNLYLLPMFLIFSCQVLISHWARALNGKLPLFTLRSLPFADIFIVIPTWRS